MEESPTRKTWTTTQRAGGSTAGTASLGQRAGADSPVWGLVRVSVSAESSAVVGVDCGTLRGRWCRSSCTWRPGGRGGSGGEGGSGEARKASTDCVRNHYWLRSGTLSSHRQLATEDSSSNLSLELNVQTL